MQILQPGMFVEARRRRWRVTDARPYDDCQLITLSGLGQMNAGDEARLLVPFDTIEPVQPPQRLRFVRTRAWRSACRELLTRGFSEHHLCTAGRARIDLLPHQLEPAIALIRGHGCRLLLADDVGLGKTIQAGLAIAELRARGAADRILIVTPAGLREQWAEELSRRFDISADVVDFGAVARRASALPYGVNPWTTWPIAISSIDYVKRAEVLAATAACAWDVIVVDEAHGLATDSDRHAAVAALAASAAYVFLLTATPHNGDRRAFASLCAIGSHGDRLLVFRRTRESVQPGNLRRVHRLFVQPSDDERRMHAMLAGFSRAVRAERGDDTREMWLALAVLHKRAYSSARALALTVERRLSALEPERETAAQLELPLDEHGESDADDDAPRWLAAIGLRDKVHERRLLIALAAAASAAAIHETKLSALSRLLRRLREPVIVFTEYRDTLLHIARTVGCPTAILHGGLSRPERAAALRAFAARERTILLATDAAGEGLNLHRGCRTVINLELPWNPMRLEQRIGRVDRIGQRRRVHAFHLIAAGTGEPRLLAGLRDRIARARTDINAPNPLGDARAESDDVDGDQRTARQVIDDTSGFTAGTASSYREPDNGGPTTYLEDGVVAARRLAIERARLNGGGETMCVHDRPRPPVAARVRNAETRRRLGTKILAVWETGIEDGCGRRISSHAVALAVALTRQPHRQIHRQWLERLLASAAREYGPLIEAAARSEGKDVIASVSSFIAARVARERSINAALAPEAFQPGLFDRRAHHAQAAARSVRAQIVDAAARRLAGLERRAALSMLPPTLRLVLVP
jgi:superfamily II DNA or RNA helicase